MTRVIVTTVLTLLMAAPAQAGREHVASADDFECVQNWAQVGLLRVHHAKKRKLKKAIRKLRRILERDKRGKMPKGTILQLTPQEAMVKRGGGFNREGGGWEFFVLEPTANGTTIVARGGAEIENPFGSCQDCHAQARNERGRPVFDFICGSDHGCPGGVLPPNIVTFLQDNDPRCGPPTE